MIFAAPETIAHVRQKSSHTQAQAAASVGVAPRQWQRWESGTATMPAAAWWLYLLRSGQATLDSLPPIPERQRMASR